MTTIQSKISTLIKNRDDRGLDLLYTHYSDSLYGIIVRITRNREVGEEILQETLLKIWNKFDQYDDTKSSLFTWMSVIARNTSIDKVRLKGFQRHRETDSLETHVNINDSGYESNEQHKIDSEKLLSSLDEKYKIIVDKVYLEGYSHRALAEELDIPLGTIKTRLRKGIQILRNELKDEKKLFLGMLLSLLALLIMVWH